MLTITATNFGVAPRLIQIKYYFGPDYLVLDGEFTVDTTAQDYAGIRPMQLTVADLPFAKSRVSTAIVTVESEGVKYATVTKVWISDKNTINIAKVLPYKSAGAYVVKFSTLLVPNYVTGLVVRSQKYTLVPTFVKGSATGVEMYMKQSGYWMSFVFKAESLNFDETDNQVVISIPDISTSYSASFPIFYNEGLWVALGSKYYPATLANGVLTISKDGNADEAAGTGFKFTRVIITAPWAENGWGDES